ncbi:MAG: DNA-protecting protein DprA [Candidatus Anammoximicrobium sp.]|nr:DNA-protecting protein DprA [Candidatus Anammoximicrobium sp.]
MPQQLFSPEPDSRDALASDLRLALTPGVGPVTRRALLERFGSAEAVLAAPPSQLREVPGVGVKLARQIVAANDEIDVNKELQLCREHGITILGDTDPAYPRLLREIHSPPAFLFIHGELRPEDALAVAIVGTRHATSYGRQTAEHLAAGLARAGLTIVSGLARGIDAVAHRAALQAGGRTLAVLGSGVLNIYPPEHKTLAEEIRGRGALISENPPLSEPQSGVFPQRNRLISGLTLGVIVVEAAERSGALISARHAMEQGREVFAVPGRVDSRTSRGCHRLIRDGAKLVECVEDVLDEFGPLVEATPRPDGTVMHHPAELQLNELELQVLNAIAAEPTSIDQIVASSGLPVQRVLATISVLEMRSLIRRVSGNSVMRR